MRDMTLLITKLTTYLGKHLITCPVLPCGRTSKKKYCLRQEHLQFLMDRKGEFALLMELST